MGLSPIRINTHSFMLSSYSRDSSFYGLPVVITGNCKKNLFFYGLRKTLIFLRKIFLKSSNHKCCQKRAKLETMISDDVEFLRSIVFRVTATICSVFHNGKSMDQGCHAT